VKNGKTGRWIGKDKDKEIYGQTGIQSYNHTDRWSDVQRDGETDRKTYIQRDRQIDIYSEKRRDM
jgi:hypothetical protein